MFEQIRTLFRWANKGTWILLMLSGPVVAASIQPSISLPSNHSIDQGEPSVLIPIRVGDADTPLNELLLSVTIDNTLLLPDSPDHLFLSGTGAIRTLRVAPDSRYSGLANLNVSVNDGEHTTSQSMELAIKPKPVKQFLDIVSVASGPADDLRIQFRDEGSGATNYLLEYLPNPTPDTLRTKISKFEISDLGDGVFQAKLTEIPTNFWVVATNVVISHLRDRLFQASTLRPIVNSTFFRIKGILPVFANLHSSHLKRDQQRDLTYFNILLNGPFKGFLNYHISLQSSLLSIPFIAGQTQVSGTTAAIEVALSSNLSRNGPARLTLTLDAGDGYEVGSQRQTTVTLQ